MPANIVNIARNHSWELSSRSVGDIVRAAGSKLAEARDVEQSLTSNGMVKLSDTSPEQLKGVGALASQMTQHPIAAGLLGVSTLATAGVVGVRHLQGGEQKSKGKGTARDGTAQHGTSPDDARNALKTTELDGPANATNVSDAKRLAIAQAALAQVGIRDITADGSLTDEVKRYKGSVPGGRPDDGNARWEAAFASWVVTEQGKIKIGADGSGSSSVTRLSDWALATGHFRPATDHNSGLKTGNLIFVERRDQSGSIWHDVGVIAGPANHSDGWVVISAGRLDGTTAKVAGTAQYVGKVGWEVMHPGDSLAKSGRHIEGYLDPVAPPLARSSKAGPLLYNSADQDLGYITPNQLHDGINLTPHQAAVACGPAAAVSMSRFLGHEITLDHAATVARTVGWGDHGMPGPVSEVKLLTKLGIKAHLETGSPDWARVREHLKAGVPVIINTPGHYWVAERYDEKTGRYDFGTSARILSSYHGTPWYSPEEMVVPSHGAPNGVIYLDAQ